MADKAPVTGTVPVQLPAGMTPEQFTKLFATFVTARVTNKERDTAYRASIKDLIAAHQAEFNGYMTKHGYTPTK